MILWAIGDKQKDNRRKGRSAAADTVDSQIKSQRIPTNKNLIPCRVILLDNTDLSVDLT
uniref:Uncharacterized protein n=1 Tax=Anopheles christyi TaxID=43041 RepID=A0A182JS49_9DIPT